MSASFPDRWHGRDDRMLDGRAGVPAIVRAVITPSNLLLAGTVASAWLGLVAWTGTGPDGWQARSCAELDLVRASCGVVRSTKDQSRIVPYTGSAAR